MKYACGTLDQTLPISLAAYMLSRTLHRSLELLYSGVFQRECLYSVLSTFSGNSRSRWGTWCELWRGVSHRGRPPQEAGLHTSGEPRPTNSTAAGLRIQCVELWPFLLYFCQSTGLRLAVNLKTTTRFFTNRFEKHCSRSQFVNIWRNECYM